MGEYHPGKDEYLELCEECPFYDCIRPEGAFSSYRKPAPGVQEFSGCPVWEQGKKNYEERYGSNGKAKQRGGRTGRKPNPP